MSTGGAFLGGSRANDITLSTRRSRGGGGGGGGGEGDEEGDNNNNNKNNNKNSSLVEMPAILQKHIEKRLKLSAQDQTLLQQQLAKFKGAATVDAVISRVSNKLQVLASGGDAHSVLHQHVKEQGGGGTSDDEDGSASGGRAGGGSSGRGAGRNRRTKGELLSALINEDSNNQQQQQQPHVSATMSASSANNTSSSVVTSSATPLPRNLAKREEYKNHLEAAALVANANANASKSEEKNSIINNSSKNHFALSNSNSSSEANSSGTVTILPPPHQQNSSSLMNLPPPFLSSTNPAPVGRTTPSPPSSFSSSSSAAAVDGGENKDVLSSMPVLDALAMLNLSLQDSDGALSPLGFYNILLYGNNLVSRARERKKNRSLSNSVNSEPQQEEQQQNQKRASSAPVSGKGKTTTTASSSSSSSSSSSKYHLCQCPARSFFDVIPRTTGPKGRYERHQLLGRGSFGETWLVEWLPEKLKKNNNNNISTSSVGSSGTTSEGKQRVSRRSRGGGGAGDELEGNNNANAPSVSLARSAGSSGRSRSGKSSTGTGSGGGGGGATYLYPNREKPDEDESSFPRGGRRNSKNNNEDDEEDDEERHGVSLTTDRENLIPPTSPLLLSNRTGKMPSLHNRFLNVPGAGAGGSTSSGASTNNATSVLTLMRNASGASNTSASSFVGGGGGGGSFSVSTAAAATFFGVGGTGGSFSSNPISSASSFGVSSSTSVAAAAAAAKAAMLPGSISNLACTKAQVRLQDGRHIPSDRTYVAKIETKQSNARKTQIGNVEKAEERILSNCAHPCVVAFVDEFVDGPNHCLVMEYVDGGDLRQEIQRRLESENVKHFSEASLLFLFVQVVMAVEYIHRHNILHRDLKTANVLLSKKWLVKLADFGFAKQFELDVDHNISVTTLGTPYYMAPEVFKREQYSAKADMWSVGVILYELMTLRRPFDGDNVSELASHVVKDDYASVQRDGISKELEGLLRKLLDKDPEQRPSAKELLQTPLMQTSMDEFIGKFTRAANVSNSALDKAWAQVLAEHQEILSVDTFSSPKSKTQMRKSRAHLVSKMLSGVMGGSEYNEGDDASGSGGGMKSFSSAQANNNNDNNTNRGGGGGRNRRLLGANNNGDRKQGASGLISVGGPSIFAQSRANSSSAAHFYNSSRTSSGSETGRESSDGDSSAITRANSAQAGAADNNQEKNENGAGAGGGGGGVPGIVVTKRVR